MLVMGILPSRSTDSPHRDQLNSVLLSEGVIERLWRCTWRLESSEFGDTLGSCDQASLKMHPRGWNRSSLEIQLEAVIEPVWRYTCRLESSECGYALGGHDRARLKEYLEEVDLEAGVREEGATGAETLFIG